MHQLREQGHRRRHQVAGVTDTQVDLETGTMTVIGETDGEAVRTAIRNAGYLVG